jgi:hypothetical protein
MSDRNWRNLFPVLDDLLFTVSKETKEHQRRNESLMSILIAGCYFFGVDSGAATIATI